MTNSIKKPNGSSSKKVGLLTRFRENNSGNFALIAAVLVPVVCMSGLYGLEGFHETMKSKKFNEYVKNACYRSIKLTRTNVLEDADRQATAQKMAEGAFPPGEYGNLQIITTAGWLTGSVDARGEFKPLINLFSSVDIPVSASFSCEGIPPYPHDKEIVMKMDFTNEQGNELTLAKNRRGQVNCWGIYDHTKIGWTGSHGWAYLANVNSEPTKVGQLEIQFWGERSGIRSSCFIDYSALPEDAPSDYAIELDAYYNNEIWRDIELHPGHYELSLWYYPRPKNGAAAVTDTTADRVTNGIGIYLEGLRGDNPMTKKPVICFNGDAQTGWRKLIYKFRVDEYNIYRFYAKGEQMSDSYGGLFNSFELKYLDDMNSTEEFLDEVTVGESPFTSYGNCTDYLDANLYAS